MTDYLDLNTPEMTERFLRAPVYRKNAVVRIRPGVKGEPVATITKSGVSETAGTVTDDDSFVVTQRGGESFILRGTEMLDRKYDPAGSPGMYHAKGTYRMFPNPTGQPVKVLALWGEQRQDADCWLATEYFPGDPDRITDDRYLVGGDEFADNDYVMTERN